MLHMQRPIVSVLVGLAAATEISVNVSLEDAPTINVERLLFGSCRTWHDKIHAWQLVGLPPLKRFVTIHFYASTLQPITRTCETTNKRNSSPGQSGDQMGEFTSRCAESIRRLGGDAATQP